MKKAIDVFQKLLSEIETLNESRKDKTIPEGFDYSVYDLVSRIVSDAKDYIDNNESVLAFEITLENLYEVEFSITQNILELLKECVKLYNFSWEHWKVLENLVVS